MSNIFEMAAIGGLILSSIGLILNAINFLYTWYKNRIKGPKFVFSGVWIDDPWIVMDDNRFASCRIMSIYQNIGDRFGYIITTSANLTVKTNNNEFTTDRLNSRLFEHRFPPDIHIKKVFSFELPIEAQNWLTAEMIVRATIYDHKGKKVEKYWKFDLVRNIESKLD